MIHLEIKETKDFDLLGPWKFDKNALAIGGLDSSLSEIKINNENFQGIVAKITVHKSILFVEVLDNRAGVFINGKKAMGHALLKAGDHLQVGHTLFEIKNFSHSEYHSSHEFSENLKKIIRSNHPVNDVIKKLEEYLRS